MGVSISYGYGTPTHIIKDGVYAEVSISYGYGTLEHIKKLPPKEELYQSPMGMGHKKNAKICRCV